MEKKTPVKKVVKTSKKIAIRKLDKIETTIRSNASGN